VSRKKHKNIEKFLPQSKSGGAGQKYAQIGGIIGGFY
jgi:hypothetical protein